MAKTFIFFLLAVSVLWSCKKEETDYRLKYTGEFTFTVYAEYWEYNQPDILDTFAYAGNIKLFLDGKNPLDLYVANGIDLQPDSTIFIRFMDNGLITTGIEKSGRLVTKSGHHYYHFGEFINVNELEFSVLGLGGLGQGSNYKIHGIRE